MFEDVGKNKRNRQCRPDFYLNSERRTISGREDTVRYVAVMAAQQTARYPERRRGRLDVRSCGSGADRRCGEMTEHVVNNGRRQELDLEGRQASVTTKNFRSCGYSVRPEPNELRAGAAATRREWQLHTFTRFSMPGSASNCGLHAPRKERTGFVAEALVAGFTPYISCAGAAHLPAPSGLWTAIVPIR